MYPLFFLLSLGICFALLLFLKKTSSELKLFDRKRGLPLIGGIGISLSFILSYALLNFLNDLILPPHLIYLLIFSFILLIIEIIDDYKDFSLKMRVTLQIIIISLFLLGGKTIQVYFFPVWLRYLLSFLWIMGITNAFNILDIGDGLCAGISLIISLTFLIVFINVASPLLINLFITLSGVLLAFLLLNLPPAKIYMGNAGSHFLGFLFATISMYGDYAGLDNVAAIFLPILVLGIPIIDTGYLIIVRMRKKVLPLKKTDDHLFFRYLSRGYSYLRALVNIYIIAIFWCLSGLFILKGINYPFLFSLGLAFLGSILLILRAHLPLH